MNIEDEVRGVAREAFDEFFPSGWSLRIYKSNKQQRLLFRVDELGVGHPQYGKVSLLPHALLEFSKPVVRTIIFREFRELRELLDDPELQAREREEYRRQQERIRNQAAGRAPKRRNR